MIKSFSIHFTRSSPKLNKSKLERGGFLQLFSMSASGSSGAPIQPIKGDLATENPRADVLAIFSSEFRKQRIPFARMIPTGKAMSSKCAFRVTGRKGAG